MINKEKSMDYTYTTMIDVIKRIAEADSPSHIRRQLERLTSDEIRKVRLVMSLIAHELPDIEYDELFREAS